MPQKQCKREIPVYDIFPFRNVAKKFERNKGKERIATP
jgi:hypothetical protein